MIGVRGQRGLAVLQSRVHAPLVDEALPEGREQPGRVAVRCQAVAQLPLVFRVASQSGQGQVQILMVERRRAADGEGAPVGRGGGFRPLQLPERQAEPVAERRVVRVSAQGRPQVFDGGLESFEAHERLRGGGGGVQVVRIAREDRPVA